METSSNTIPKQSVTWYGSIFFYNMKKFMEIADYDVCSSSHTVEFEQTNEQVVTKVKSTWRLHVFPDGFSNETRGYVSVFLELVDLQGVSQQEVRFTISIITSGNVHVDVTDACQVFVHGLDWGNSTFVARESLLSPQSPLWADGTLRLCCELELKVNGTEPIAARSQAGSSNFFKNSELLWQQMTDKKYTDVTFKVTGRESGENFHVHKVVMAGCQYFDAMFNSNMREAENSVITIEDVEPETFREIVRYIYTGRADKLEELAMDLIVSADRFGLVDLMKKCEKTISEHLAVENIIAVFELCTFIKARRLKKHVKKFIVAHPVEVTGHESYLSLLKENRGLETVKEISMLFAKEISKNPRKKLKTRHAQ